MASDEGTPGVINLDWTASKVYEYPSVDELDIPDADLSQLGVRRNKLRTEWQFPLVREAKFILPFSAIEPVIGKKFPQVLEDGSLRVDEHGIPVLGVPPDNAEVEIIVSTDTIGNGPLPIAAISALQDALRPAAAAYGADLVKDPNFAAYVAHIADQSGLYATQVATWLLPLLKSEERLSDEFIEMGLGKLEEHTETPAEHKIKEEDIRTASIGVMLRIAAEARAREVPEAIQKSVDKLEFLALYRAYPGSDGLVDHPAVTGFVARLRGEIVAKVVPPVPVIDNSLAIHATKRVDNVDIQCNAIWRYETSETVREVVPYKLTHEKLHAWFTNLGVYLVNYILSGDSNIEDNADFAFTRVLIARKKLLWDSDECVHARLRDEMRVRGDVVTAFRQRLKEADPFEVAIYLSNISYLKSGHHATMFNIDRNLKKMLKAVNIAYTTEEARRFVKTAVYYGSHVASTRLSIYKMYRDAQTLQLSKAIVNRMNPVPPTFAAVCNLQIFVTALADARFFELTDKTHQFAEFKAAMAHIRSVMHLAAPYSGYLYGATLPDPIAQKHVALEFAAYAAAIKDVMPLSSLILSPSLTNAANQAATNSIAAVLTVTAYVSAYRRYFRGMVSEKMARQVNARLPAPE